MAPMKFTGTGVAIVTPFRNDGSIDFQSLGRILEHIINGKVDYVVVLGTTGESVTLSKDEKQAVVSYVIDSVNGRIPIVVGIGGNNTQEVLDALNHNELSGVDAILSVAPYYNKPSQQGLYLHFKSIAAVSRLPVILYNVPGRTGSNISADTTLKLAHELKNVIAIKEASGNFDQIMQIIKKKPKNFQVISGDDALTLPMMALGASGVISVVANAYPGECAFMVKEALMGNFTRALDMHYKLLDMVHALFEEGSPSGIKAVLEIIKLSQNNVRLPLAPVSTAMYRKLEGLVNELSNLMESRLLSQSE
jgi:4-hydroxy-tetrahydrodipicolinate synthase